MRALLLSALVLAAGGLIACGGDDDKKKGPAGSESNPVVALPNPTKTRTPQKQPKNEKAPSAEKTDAAGATRPCSLVTASQARKIIGAPIAKPVEAPQGPSCLYEGKDGQRSMTLTVQRASFAQLAKQVRRRRNVTVSGRRAVCGNLGRAILYVPVSDGRVLTVAGPCNVATRFAARALTHL